MFSTYPMAEKPKNTKIAVHLGFLKKTHSGKSKYFHDVIAFEKALFPIFFDLRSVFLQRTSVDGRPSHRNKDVNFALNPQFLSYSSWFRLFYTSTSFVRFSQLGNVFTLVRRICLLKSVLKKRIQHLKVIIRFLLRLIFVWNCLYHSKNLHN